MVVVVVETLRRGEAKATAATTSSIDAGAVLQFRAAGRASSKRLKTSASMRDECLARAVLGYMSTDRLPGNAAGIIIVA